MKALFIKYKGVLTFLLLFSGSYLMLSICYSVYLSLTDGSAYPPDFITNLVAKQSTTLLESLGYKAYVLPHPSQPSMELFVNDMFLARIVEGCNAISVLILFVSFVVAFAQRFKKTLLFIVAGTALIYAVNIIRIAVLAIALYEYPQHGHLLHGVVFPSIIYGIVVLLWLVWVRNLAPTTKKVPAV